MAAGGVAGGGARGLRLKQGKPALCALTIPVPPLIHCMVPVKSGFSEAPVAGAGCLELAGLAGLELAKTPAPPLPPLLHSPTAQSPPPWTSPSVRLFHPSRQALLRCPAALGVLGRRGSGGGSQPTAFVPCQGLKTGKLGAGRRWG